MDSITDRKGTAINTELLQTFAVVVRTRSFTAAARELGYVQSTVTGHVQALERSLAVRLLDRLPAGAVPTDAGRRLLPLADQMLGLQARIRAEVPTGSGQPTGPVRLSAPESLCAYRLPEMIAKLRADEPNVRLSLMPAGTATALNAVRRGASDMALILEPPMTQPGVVLEAVGIEELVLLSAPSAAAGGDQPRTWADLARIETLLLEEGCSYSDAAARHLQAAGQPDRRRTHFGSIEAVKRCAAVGLGWTVLPAVTAAPELRAGTLSAVPGPSLQSCIVHLATHADRSVGVAAQVVINSLRGVWADVPA